MGFLKVLILILVSGKPMRTVFPVARDTTMGLVGTKDNVALKFGRGRVFGPALTGEDVTFVIILKANFFS